MFYCLTGFIYKQSQRIWRLNFRGLNMLNIGLTKILFRTLELTEQLSELSIFTLQKFLIFKKFHTYGPTFHLIILINRCNLQTQFQAQQTEMQNIQVIKVWKTDYFLLEMEKVCKRICQCYSCACCACMVSTLIIVPWHACISTALSALHCYGCCWSIYAPCWTDCSCPRSGPIFDSWTTSMKYCLLSVCLWSLTCTSIDGCYNSYKVAQLACCGEEGIKSYADMIKNAETLGNKVRQSLGLQVGEQPLRAMDTFKP